MISTEEIVEVISEASQVIIDRFKLNAQEAEFLIFKLMGVLVEIAGKRQDESRRR